LSRATICYVTCPSLEIAYSLGEVLVAERLAACANILPGMQSIYRWEGQVETASETVLLLKTRPTLVEALTRRVVELHEYQVPCVVALPIEGGSADYLSWIERETLPQFSTED
jgi:periplasmic divalent cation tolerance protein